MFGLFKNRRKPSHPAQGTSRVDIHSLPLGDRLTSVIQRTATDIFKQISDDRHPHDESYPRYDSDLSVSDYELTGDAETSEFLLGYIYGYHKKLLELAGSKSPEVDNIIIHGRALKALFSAQSWEKVKSTSRRFLDLSKYRFAYGAPENTQNEYLRGIFYGYSCADAMTALENAGRYTGKPSLEQLVSQVSEFELRKKMQLYRIGKRFSFRRRPNAAVSDVILPADANSLQSKFSDKEWQALQLLPFCVFGWVARAEARVQNPDGVIYRNAATWSMQEVRIKEMGFQLALRGAEALTGRPLSELCDAVLKSLKPEQFLELAESAVEDALDPSDPEGELRSFQKLISVKLPPQEYSQFVAGLLKLAAFIAEDMNKRPREEEKQIRARQARDLAILEAIFTTA
jgi:hypothetical protein